MADPVVRLMEQERERSFGRGMMEGIGGIRSKGLWTSYARRTSCGPRTRNHGTEPLDNLGMTWSGRTNESTQRFQSNGWCWTVVYKDHMYGAQFDAANTNGPRTMATHGYVGQYDARHDAKNRGGNYLIKPTPVLIHSWDYYPY